MEACRRVASGVAGEHDPGLREAKVAGHARPVTGLLAVDADEHDLALGGCRDSGEAGKLVPAFLAPGSEEVDDRRAPDEVGEPDPFVLDEGGQREPCRIGDIFARSDTPAIESDEECPRYHRDQENRGERHLRMLTPPPVIQDVATSSRRNSSMPVARTTARSGRSDYESFIFP